jgi:hypothetical protein
MSANQELVAELAKLGYLNLFMRAGTEHMDGLWTAAQGPDKLEAVALDPAVPWESRFLAAEILFRKRDNFPRADQREVLAAAYVDALEGATIGNLWGLPGELNGPAGQHLMSLGEPVTERLATLLDDDRAVLYIGSQDATWGNRFKFRVKDFAAFFLCSIKNLPYALHTEPAARDADIQALIAHIRHH